MADLTSAMLTMLPHAGRSAIMELAARRDTLRPSEYVARRSQVSATLGLTRHPEASVCEKCGGQGFVGEAETERLCELCDSLGYTLPEKAPACPACNGTQFVRSSTSKLEEVRATPCPRCAGAITYQRREVDRWFALHQADVPRGYREFTIATFLDRPALSDSQHQAALLVAGWAEKPEVFASQHGRRGIVLAGGVGVGKTGLAIGAIAEAAAWAVRPRFVSWLRLQSRIADSYGSGSSDSRYRLLDELVRADVLVLDDFGTGGKLATEHAIGIAEELIEGRVTSGHATLITTNLSREQLEAEFGARVASRVDAMCEWAELTGEDARRERVPA